jgi:hypothetical protein
MRVPSSIFERLDFKWFVISETKTPGPPPTGSRSKHERVRWGRPHSLAFPLRTSYCSCNGFNVLSEARSNSYLFIKLHVLQSILGPLVGNTSILGRERDRLRQSAMVKEKEVVSISSEF